jgi:hypothetical protein
MAQELGWRNIQRIMSVAETLGLSGDQFWEFWTKEDGDANRKLLGEILRKDPHAWALIQFVQKLNAMGFSTDVIRTAQEDPRVMLAVREVLDAHQAYLGKQHVVNLDTPPKVPRGLTILRHRPGEKIVWDPSMFTLCQFEEQLGGAGMWSHRALARIEENGWHVYNIKLRDFLLRRPYFIPQEFEGKKVMFPDTVFSDSSGRAVIHGMLSFCGKWGPCECYVDRPWKREVFFLINADDHVQESVFTMSDGYG